MSTTIEAGPELDARIADKVLGIKWDESRCRVCGWPLDPEGKMCRPDNCALRPRPARMADAPAPYSTNDDVAMILARKVCKAFGCSMRVEADIAFEGSDNGDRWEATFFDDYQGYFTLKGRELGLTEASTMAMAICLAALRVVGE